MSSLSTGLSTTNSNLATAGKGAAEGLGGGASYNPTTGEWTAPSYTVYNQDGSTSKVNNVGSAIDAINNKGTKYFHANSIEADSQAIGKNAVAIGPKAVASGDSSVAMGLGAQATGTNAIAIGTGALATGSQAIGANALAGGGGVALGDGADAGGTPLSKAPGVSRGTAIGFGAVVQSQGGVALGTGSQATRAGMNGQTEAISGVAVSSTQGAVSVGSAGNERQITNVAGGTQATDAVNVRQLQASQAGGVRYDTNPDGSTNYSQVTLGNGQAPMGTRIGNVAAGILPNDAVNVQQLNEVRGQVNDVARIAYSGTAMAFAMAGTYLPTLYPGEKTVGLGVGFYKGYGAVGLTFKSLSNDGKMSWGAGISTTGKEWGVNAGIGWKWR